MNVASLELCKELYKLSGGWNEVDFWWHELKDGWSVGMPFSPGHNDIPAYDLGYLLRKLPADGLSSITIFKKTSTYKDGVHTKYEAHYKYEILGDPADIWEYADTPEDAAAKLAIELFKQGISGQETL